MDDRRIGLMIIAPPLVALAVVIVIKLTTVPIMTIVSVFLLCLLVFTFAMGLVLVIAGKGETIISSRIEKKFQSLYQVFRKPPDLNKLLKKLEKK